MNKRIMFYFSNGKSITIDDKGETIAQILQAYTEAKEPFAIRINEEIITINPAHVTHVFAGSVGEEHEPES